VNAITLTGTSEVKIAIETRAVESRDLAVSSAQALPSVSSESDARAAANIIRDLRSIQKQTEESRSDVKRPVLDLGKRIDAIAKEFIGPVESELSRVSRLLTTWQVEQDRIAREAEAKRQAELRAAAEAEAKARAEAERARAKAEAEARAAAKKAESESDPFALAEAEAAAKAARDRESQKIQQAEEAARAARLKAAQELPVAQKLAGVTVKRQPDFEILDLQRLARSRPDLVTITPKRADIIAEIRKAGEWDGKRPVPGIDGIAAWWDGKAVVR
jgi:hypothetical protein